MANGMLEDKIRRTHDLLEQLLREQTSTLKQDTIIKAFSGYLEELYAAAEEIQQQQSELLKANQQLMQQSQRYQELFEHTPNGYLVTDINGKIQEANQAAARLFNAPQQYLIDKPLTVFIEEGYLQGFWDLLQQVMGNKKTIDWETALKSRQNSSFPALLSVAGAYDLEGIPVQLRWIILDMTEIKHREAERSQLIQKNLEQQLALRQAQQQLAEVNKLKALKSSFLSSVSHELRAPVANIKLALATLKKHVYPNERSERYLQILDHECTREISLLDNLLNLQQEEEVTWEVRNPVLEQIQLSQWVAQTLQPLIGQAELKEFQLVISAEANLPPMIVDTGSLQSILVELINNASKYNTLPGNILIHTQTGSNSTANRPTQSISVTNNCPKIPSSQLARLFEMFYRIPTENLYAQGGTGVGLAVVRKLVEQLEGTLRVQSIDRQTTFTVEIPLQITSVLDTEVTTTNFEFLSGIILSSAQPVR